MESDPTQSHKEVPTRGLAFAVRVAKFCEELAATPGAKRILAGRLLRFSVSLGARLEQAQASESLDEFLQSMTAALKLARETRYWLRVARAADYAPAEVVSPLFDEVHALAQSVVILLRAEREKHGL